VILTDNLSSQVPTAEDVTSARRAERKIYKQVKAKERADEREKLAEAMLDKAAGGTESSTSASTSAKATGTDSTIAGPAAGLADKGAGEKEVVKAGNAQLQPARTRDEAAPQSKSAPSKNSRRAREVAAATARQQQVLAERGEEVKNLEHTQLQREEAFFLVFAIGSLAILPPKPSTGADTPMKLKEVWQAFMSASTSIPQSIPSSSEIRPDNPFLLSYVVYHHYRSLGWVVRNGIKFCVDWVLYKGADGTSNPRGGAGPVGGHAESVHILFLMDSCVTATC
jgi:tRNA-splicing endonuclease subunit Sen2